MRTADTNVGAFLSIRDLSFVRTFSKGSWFSNIYMPPVTAQFLNNVSFDVFHGEVHGIIGAAGSGKTTFLQVLANRAQGTITGEAILNGEDLTDERFSRLCEYVNFDIQLLDFLSVEQSVRFQAQLTLNCNSEAISHRALNLLQQFDLMPYAQTSVSNLTKSALKRLILVLHLVKDPVLILIDDPLVDMDSLSNYQMISALTDHVKRNSRMAIVTMRYPRSDIYQLLAQLTLLFYGETVYSGPTKYMPHYFSQIGYRCPVSENPAVYYLSLATVDRETPDSYNETQSKAASLVDIFKKKRPTLDFSAYHDESLSDTPVLSCYFGSPSASRCFSVLFSRFLLMFIRVYSCISAQFLLLTFVLFIATFGTRFYSIEKHAPNSSAGTIFALTFFTAISSIFCTVYSFKNMRLTMLWEVSEGLYSSCLVLFAFLLASGILDVFSILLSSISFIWIVYPAFTTSNLFALIITMSCTYLFYKLLVLMLFTFVADIHKLLWIAITICCLSSIFSGGFLKSYISLINDNEILLHLTITSPERFANLVLFNEFVNKTRIPACRRNEQQPFTRVEDFCRWKNGEEYLSEILSNPNYPPQLWQSLFIIVIGTLITLVSFIMITSKRAQAMSLK